MTDNNNIMSIFERLNNDVKNYLKNGDKDKVVLIRGIISKIKDETVNKGKEITEEISQKCVERTLKEIEQSIESFKKAGRDETVEKLNSDKTLVSSYLPKMLSTEETLAIINTIVKTIEPVRKNMGLIMKQLPKEVNKSMAASILNGMIK